MNSENQKFIETANGRIYYFLDQPYPERPTVIFLHGLSANHTTGDNITDALRHFQLNFLLPDLRGHGHSDKSKNKDFYKLSVFTEDLKKIIQQENLSKVILIGYSFGGYIALDYAAKNPASVASLILISANHVNPLVYKKLGFLTKPVYATINFLAWLLLWQKRNQYAYYDQKTATGYFNSTFTGFTTMPLSVNLWMLAEVFKLDLSRDIANIACPTLIARSKGDLFFSAGEACDMAKKIPSARIFTIKKATHFLASRHQENIIEFITDFLKKERLI